ncbi:MAG TPA: phosphatase PAP2 family protein, partial [Bacteroidota bacterium]|nr:phosphatase PAP2 family protein [Bacteroidota bacterium]
FAVATLFSSYYRKWRWAFYAWASLVALSRPAVGVHYPSDILGGALIGVAVALAVVFSWNALCRRYLPRIAVTPAGAPPP